MRLTHGLTSIVAAFFVAGSVGCGASTPEAPSGQAGGTSAGTKNATRVTDTVAIALSAEEREKLIDTVEDAAGIPGTVRWPDDAMPFVGAPCTPRNRWCLEITVSGDDARVVLTDRDSGGSCTDADGALCDGVEIPAKAAEPLVRALKSGLAKAPDRSTTPLGGTTPTEPTGRSTPPEQTRRSTAPEGTGRSTPPGESGETDGPAETTASGSPDAATTP